MAAIPDDRRVHGITAAGNEIVRYDRAGKWYIEYRSGGRSLLTLDAAVAYLSHSWAEWFPGIPGGSALDRRMAKL